MVRFYAYFFLLALPFSFLLSVQKKPLADISLFASEELVEGFVHFTRQRYKPAELDLLFSKMNEDGNLFCQMAAGKKKFSKKKAAAFIKPDKLSEFRTNCKMCLKSMKAGCWNFFKMNDQRPERDFKLVHYLFNKPAYSCYSVGFLQPYIMHNYLNCQNLTMIDIDWRILYGHFQFIRLVKAETFANENDLSQSLSKLRLSWVAHHDRYYVSDTGASMSILCKSRQRKVCRRHILDFQQNHGTVQNFRLNLAGLHHGDYRQKADLVRVIYLSNAIEKIYTSQSQFNLFMQNLFVSLKPNETAVLIHHVGGYPQFGLYEFQRKASEYRVRTICRDKYRNTAFGSTEPFYESYFEKITKDNGPIISCQRLLAQFERAGKNK